MRTGTRIVTVIVAFGVGLLFFTACGDDRGTELTPTPTREPEATIPSDSAVTVQIINPEEGDAVPMQTRVEVMVEPFELGEQLHVLVRPIPDDPNQDYWVQAEPGPINETLWASDPVFVGIETDRPSLPFRTCAVITAENLERGQRLRTLPSGPSHCVNVTRQ